MLTKHITQLLLMVSAAVLLRGSTTKASDLVLDHSDFVDKVSQTFTRDSGSRKTVKLGLGTGDSRLHIQTLWPHLDSDANCGDRFLGCQCDTPTGEKFDPYQCNFFECKWNLADDSCGEAEATASVDAVYYPVGDAVDSGYKAVAASFNVRDLVDDETKLLSTVLECPDDARAVQVWTWVEDNHEDYSGDLVVCSPIGAGNLLGHNCTWQFNRLNKHNKNPVIHMITSCIPKVDRNAQMSFPLITTLERPDEDEVKSVTVFLESGAEIIGVSVWQDINLDYKRDRLRGCKCSKFDNGICTELQCDWRVLARKNAGDPGNRIAVAIIVVGYSCPQVSPTDDVVTTRYTRLGVDGNDPGSVVAEGAAVAATYAVQGLGDGLLMAEGDWVRGKVYCEPGEVVDDCRCVSSAYRIGTNGYTERKFDAEEIQEDGKFGCECSYTDSLWDTEDVLYTIAECMRLGSLVTSEECKVRTPECGFVKKDGEYSCVQDMTPNERSGSFHMDNVPPQATRSRTVWCEPWEHIAVPSDCSCSTGGSFRVRENTVVHDADQNIVGCECEIKNTRIIGKRDADMTITNVCSIRKGVSQGQDCVCTGVEPEKCAWHRCME